MNNGTAFECLVVMMGLVALIMVIALFQHL